MAACLLGEGLRCADSAAVCSARSVVVDCSNLNILGFKRRVTPIDVASLSLRVLHQL